MKAKLVKYPYDEKKYRWDTYGQNKEFQYFWDESIQKNYQTIEPYIQVEPFVYDENKIYAKINLDGEASKKTAYSDRTFTINNTIQTNGWYYSGVDVTDIAYSFVRQYLGYDHIIWGQQANEAGAYSVVMFYISNYGMENTNHMSSLSQLTLDDGSVTNIGIENEKCFFVWENRSDTNYDINNREDRIALFNKIRTDFHWGNWHTTDSSYDTELPIVLCSKLTPLNRNIYFSTAKFPLFVDEKETKYNGTDNFVFKTDALNSYSWSYNGNIITKGVIRTNSLYTTRNYPMNMVRIKGSSYFNVSYNGFADWRNRNFTEDDEPIPPKNTVEDFEYVVDINDNNLYGLPQQLFNKIYTNSDYDFLLKYLKDNRYLENIYLGNDYWFKNEPQLNYSKETINGVKHIYISMIEDGAMNKPYYFRPEGLNEYGNRAASQNRVKGGNYTSTLKYDDMAFAPRYNYSYDFPDNYNISNRKFIYTKVCYKEDITWRGGSSANFVSGRLGHKTNFRNAFYAWDDFDDYPAEMFVIHSITHKVIIDIISGENRTGAYGFSYKPSFGSITFTLSNSNTGNYLINVDEWLDGGLRTRTFDYDNFEILHNQDKLQNIDYIYKPVIKLIGDKTDLDIVVPEGNNSILYYDIGIVVNNVFNKKYLQVYRPSGNGKYTWLTFNYYATTPLPFYYDGDLWNHMGSPFAYINGMNGLNESKEMVFEFDVCPAGNYRNIFQLFHNPNLFNVKDNLNNTYITKNDTLTTYKHYFDDNLGGLYYFGTGEVSSTNRHAYPDNGTQSGYVYKLRPEDTKFLRYIRSRDQLVNVELFSDRYTYTHDTVDFCDRSWEGRTIGTTTSTNEDIVPDGTWREYLGLYLGESIPFLHITETIIPPSEILGVPQYDKQVNTSDTLKYGTVASASLSFTLNKPVNNCLSLNNQLLVLFYDFKNTDEWERLGFFRIDNIEALDEYSTSLLAHDETYKLNKYVDDFLEGYTQSTTLDLFYRDLLDYCDCFYDTHQPIIHNGSINMSNVYHAVKTTGVQVAHYVAILVPGFIHTNIDGDIVLSQYQIVDNNLTTSDYSNLVYCAYNTDMINKIKIASNNTVKGESAGSGENVYFLADDPLLSELQASSYFNNLADGILAYYTTIPAYRPATIDFLILPRGLAIGDIVNLTTPKNENYSVIIMKMSITSSGVQVQSFGTQKYPVEAESNSEFVNLINDMGEISGDVSNMREAQQTMATAIAENAAHINQNSTNISTIITKNTQQDNAISAVQTQANGFGVTVSNNLASIVLNGTVNNIATKNYVDAGDTATLNSAKAYADTIGLVFDYGTLTYNITNSQSATQYSADVMWIGDREHKFGIFVPQRADTTHDMWKLMNATGYYFSGSTWALMYNATYRYN